jgi:predicted nuclease of predicted toxin-antitoxin system
MKILLDRNLSPHCVQALAAAGITSADWSSVGSAQASDPELIAHVRCSP